MGTTNNGFITADLAGNNTVADMAVHQEISAVENDILLQSNLGFLSVTVSDTLMTNANLPVSVNLSSVSTSPSNGFTLSGNPVLPTGTPVMFTSTSTLPSPLMTGTIYYLVSVTSTLYTVAASRQNALQPTPIVVVLTDIGSGTHTIQPMNMSQLYFHAWQNYAYNPEFGVYSAQMRSVTNYFTGLGYRIDRRQNTSTNSTFSWYITWG